jgi:hypothetical protein
MLACPYIDSRPGCFNIMFATQQACEKAGADLRKATGIGSNLRQYSTVCVHMEIYK